MEHNLECVLYLRMPSIEIEASSIEQDRDLYRDCLTAIQILSRNKSQLNEMITTDQFVIKRELICACMCVCECVLVKKCLGKNYRNKLVAVDSKTR